MSLKNDGNQLHKPKDLDLILTIIESFDSIDKQNRLIAQFLHKKGTIYYSYAVLDSLSSVSSMSRYFYDIFNPDGNSDALHHFMMSPDAIIGITLETLFLVGFSTLAVKFDGEKNNKYKQFIATAWPYLRDVMKGLKNAYKGWRSTIIALSLLSHLDIKYLIAPIGIILGVFAAINRFCLRYMVEDRKLMMVVNDDLKKEIKKLDFLTHGHAKTYLSKIKYQSRQSRSLVFISVAAGGFLDGLYLYVGVIGLTVLSFPMLSLMVGLCIFYTVACVITRIYEEYDFQERLFITQTKCQLEIIAKQLETAYAALLNKDDTSNTSDHEHLTAEICLLFAEFDKQRNVLTRHTTHTYYSATLLGIKHGLYVYGALSSTLFFTAALFSLAGFAFPPALLFATVILGLVSIGIFLAHSLRSHTQFLEKQKITVNRSYDQLVELHDTLLKNRSVTGLINLSSFCRLLDRGMIIYSSPQFNVPEYAECARSTFSGLAKGQKVVSFAGNSFQDIDEQGHFHDSRLMLVFSFICALVFAIILGARAAARGLGRDDKLSQFTADDANEQSLVQLSKPDNLQTSKDERSTPESEPIHYPRLSFMGRLTNVEQARTQEKLSPIEPFTAFKGKGMRLFSDPLTSPVSTILNKNGTDGLQHMVLPIACTSN